MNRLVLHEKSLIKNHVRFGYHFGCSSALKECFTLILVVGQLTTACISILILKHSCYWCRPPWVWGCNISVSLKPGLTTQNLLRSSTFESDKICLYRRAPLEILLPAFPKTKCQSLRSECRIQRRICTVTVKERGAVWRSYATTWQVAGSIPDGVRIFSPWHNPAGRTMALGSTQPLTEMSTRCVSCHQECSWG